MRNPTRSGTAATTATLVVVVLVASALLGMLAASLSAREVLVMSLGGGSLVILLLLGRFIAGAIPRTVGAAHSSAGGLEAPHTGELDIEALDIRCARLLFYAGTLSLTWAAWRPALGLTASELIFIAALMLCAVAALRGEPVVPLPIALFAGVCAFSVGGAISSVNARLPSESGLEVLQGIYVMLLWAWTAAMVLRTRRHVLIALSLWAASAAVNGAAAIMEVAGFDVLVGSLQGERASGFTQHPNDLGAAAAVALVPALLLAVRHSRSSVRLVAAGITALVAAGLVLSASIGALAAALAAITFWLTSPGLGARTRVAVAALVASTLAVLTLVEGPIQSPVERVELVTSATETRPGAGSGRARASIVEVVWPAIRERPVVGAGLDRHGKVVTIVRDGRVELHQIHGGPLAAWYEAGIFGLVGVLVVVGSMILAARRAAARASGYGDVLVTWTLAAALVAFAAYALTTPFVFQQYGWFAGVTLLAWRLRRDAEPASHAVNDPGRSTSRSAHPQPLRGRASPVR